MQVGDWVYCRELDEEFKIQAIKDLFLQKNDVIWVTKDACELVNVEVCPRCQETCPVGEVHVQYSFGVYAGRFCDKCCSGYRDNCGLDGCQGNPQDLDEAFSPDDYY